MFSTPETSVHVRDKNREISPLETEEGYGGKDPEKRWVLRREWKTPRDTPTTDLGAESEPANGGEHSEVADWQGTWRDGGSLCMKPEGAKLNKITAKQLDHVSMDETNNEWLVMDNSTVL